MSLLMRRSLPCGTLAFRRACHPSLSPAFNRCAPLCLRQTVRPAGRFFTAPRPTEPSEAPPTDASAAATGAEAVGEGSAPSGGKATVCGKYGAIGVAIYLGIYAGTFGMCYLLLSSGVLQEDHVETIAQWLMLDKLVPIEHQKGAGTLALAFVFTKILGPVRWTTLAAVCNVLFRSPKIKQVVRPGAKKS